MAHAEGDQRVEAFADALERGDLDSTSSAGAVQSGLGIPQGRLRPYRDALAATSNVRELIVALRAASAVASVMAADEQLIQLAWTFPGHSSPGHRTTGGVAREIIDGSRVSLLVVGFAVTVDSQLSGLAAQTVDALGRAAARGVVVTAVLHRAVNRHALLGAWRVGVQLPSIFTWLPSDDSKAAMHAKLLVSDRSDALVTSANLTYHGFERNLEMGIRVTGRPAAEIHDRIHGLISTGDLVPWLE